MGYKADIRFQNLTIRPLHFYGELSAYEGFKATESVFLIEKAVPIWYNTLPK